MTSSAHLPAVGTRYSSVDEFKRDVYEVCLAQGYKLVVSVSGGVSSELSCSLMGARRLAKKPCTCFVFLKSVARTSPAQFVVSQSCSTHSCSEDIRRAGEEKAKAFIEKRLRALEADEEKEEEDEAGDPSTDPSPSRSKRRRVVNTGYVFDEEQDNALDLPPQNPSSASFPSTPFSLPISYDSFAPTLPPKSPSKATFSLGENSSPSPRRGKGKEVEADGVSECAGVARKAGQASSSAAVDIPPFQQRFFRLHDLLNHLHAFASHIGFRFFNNDTPSSNTYDSFRLVGALFPKKRSKVAIIREVFGAKAANETWGVVEHTFRRVKVVEGKGKGVEKNDPAKKPPLEPVPVRSSTPVNKAPPASPRPFPGSEDPQPEAKASPSYRLPPTTSLSLSSSLPPFLAAVSPFLSSCQRSTYSQLLLKSGLKSVDDLVEVLLMDERGLKIFVEDTKRKMRCKEEEAQTLFEVLEAAAKKLREG